MFHNPIDILSHLLLTACPNCNINISQEPDNSKPSFSGTKSSYSMSHDVIMPLLSENHPATSIEPINPLPINAIDDI